jgi:SanA protein
MDAAAQLYKAGAINRLLLSGDNRYADYNEPVAMRDALRQRGIPEAALSLDYAGFRTLDSIIRAKKVFQLEQDVIIVTDDFHLPRALFLAEETGLHALGFSAEPVPWKRSYRTRFREYLSRARACLDVYLWKTQPHFLGAPIQLPPGIEP